MRETSRLGLVLLVLAGLGVGCGRKSDVPQPQTPTTEAMDVSEKTPVPAAPTTPEVKPAAPAVASGAEAGGETQSATKHPMVSQATWDMPAGKERSLHVRLEVLEQQLDDLNREMQSASLSVMETEKQVRTENPEIGQLYDQLVNAQIEYREALEKNALYAAVRQKNVDTIEKYRTAAEERDNLKKEINQ